ncbi:transcription factor MYB98-like [Magnolia sinica]|uniref:transcription factor MYB98-like n=1 Tax=Magnolia sinica TaxID=86752 RepID=UPI002659746D|nr:transcription factor MYB98-like [Magnolia sinica]
MEFFSRFRGELALPGPAFLPEYCPKADIRDGFSFEACSSKGPQDLLNFDQFSTNGLLPNSNFDPFGAFASGYSSNFDVGGGIKTFVAGHGDGVFDNFQNVGERIEQDRCRGLNFCNSVEPMNFVLPDEISCVTGDNGIYGEVGLSKKNMQVKRSGKIQKKSHVVKGQWTLEEDKLLVHLVEQFGLRKWSQIAKMLNGRMGKQCRERWHNHLRPNIKKDIWSEEEDLVIIQAHAEIGNKWAEIAKRLPGRTENSIKNRWNATKRRQFSRRKCRSSKYPKPSSLLQDYIRSLMSAGPTGRPENKRTSTSTPSSAAAVTAMHDQAGDSDCDRLVPNYCDFSDVMDFPIDVDVTTVGSIFDDMMMMPSADGVDEKCMEMEMELDVESFMQCENVKKEMDLVEMISQSNNTNKF